MTVQERIHEVAKQVAGAASGRGLTVACAESLTSGAIASALGAAPSSADWFRGGVVAYAAEVKWQVLGVPEGPVVCEPAARRMAQGVSRLLGADVAVSVTGVGGPEPEEGEPVGTVYFGVADGTGVHVEHRWLDGEPSTVVQETTLLALRILLDRMTGAGPS